MKKKTGNVIQILSNSKVFKEGFHQTDYNERLLALSSHTDYKSLESKIIGKHEGAHYFTIGQRKGIRIGGNKNYSEKPWFVINKDIDPEEVPGVIAHEEIHIEQMKRGDLDYDNENVYWKGKKYSRADMEEGAQNLPWEAEAYKRS